MKTIAITFFTSFLICSQGIDMHENVKLNQIIQKCNQLNEQGALHGGLLIAKEEEVLYQESFGNSHLSKKNLPESSFNIASIGKIFTGVAIMQLVEQGKLNLDDTIYDIFPEYENQKVAKRVTVHHLLTHTSGIPDFWDIKHLKNKAFEDYKSNVALIEEFDQIKKVAKPGKKWSYSNTGYAILGGMIERLSGRSYHDFLKTNIYKVSEMSETNGGLGFGGQESTMLDLKNLALALSNNKLLTKKTKNLAMQGKVKTEKDVYYGYGFFDSAKLNSREVSHSGGAENINCQLQLFVEKGYIVVIYNNNPKEGFKAYQELRQYIRYILS